MSFPAGLEDMCRCAKLIGASDLHVVADRETCFRVHGDLEGHDAVLSKADYDRFVNDSSNETQKDRYKKTGAIDCATSHAEFGRMRIHGYRTYSGDALTLRFLPDDPPPFEQLNVPRAIRTFIERSQGLVLFSGMTGSGKTTLQASLIHLMNQTMSRRIVTFEDPIEYVFRSHRSQISQCEVGDHISSFAEGLRGVMRADPDVIILGEMRDPPTVEAALAAAETGHLVFATIHASEASHVTERMLGFFSAGHQVLIRAQLAQTLLGVVGMNLVKTRDGKHRRAAVEVLIGTSSVRSLIQQGKTNQIRNAMQTGKNDGMQTLEMHLDELISQGLISGDEAKSVTPRPEELKRAS
jgi:twitching motility protein PilT